jgi:hypothetical protein
MRYGLLVRKSSQNMHPVFEAKYAAISHPMREQVTAANSWRSIIR